MECWNIGIMVKTHNLCVWIKGFGTEKAGGVECWNNGTLGISLTQYSNNPVFQYPMSYGLIHHLYWATNSIQWAASMAAIW